MRGGGHNNRVIPYSARFGQLAGVNRQFNEMNQSGMPGYKNIHRISRDLSADELTILLDMVSGVATRGKHGADWRRVNIRKD